MISVAEFVAGHVVEFVGGHVVGGVCGWPGSWCVAREGGLIRGLAEMASRDLGTRQLQGSSKRQQQQTAGDRHVQPATEFAH